jgi:hypothetical protein
MIADSSYQLRPQRLRKVETVRFVARRIMQARPRGVIWDDLIGLTAHDAVAFARRLRETAPIDFDQAPPI